MGFKEYLNENLVFLDGGMGTMLQLHGMQSGELPEMWNLRGRKQCGFNQYLRRQLLKV